jgi:hypothetical protein
MPSTTLRGNGREAAKAFFGSAGPVDVEVHRIIAEGDLVAVQHWDVLQQVPETTASGNDLFIQLN